MLHDGVLLDASPDLLGQCFGAPSELGVSELIACEFRKVGQDRGGEHV